MKCNKAMKKAPVWFRLIRIYFKTLKQIILLPYRKLKKLLSIANISKNNKKTFENEQTNDFCDGCVGCGCSLIILGLIFAAVSWAWGIHWAFGLLLLLFILGIR